MKITRNEVKFANKSIAIKTGTEYAARMDYILSMLADQIMFSLRHLNRPAFWEDEAEMFQIHLPVASGETVLLSIINISGNKIQVLVDGKVMEEADEFVFANEFLEKVRSTLPELISDFKDQKTVYSQIKADLRSDLNNLELVIDRYER